MWSGSFTKNAQAALTLAEKTAARLHTGYVGTEHILVGLLKEESGVAAKILEDNGADADKILVMTPGSDCSRWGDRRERAGNVFTESTESTGGGVCAG